MARCWSILSYWQAAAERAETERGDHDAARVVEDHDAARVVEAVDWMLNARCHPTRNDRRIALETKYSMAPVDDMVGSQGPSIASRC